MSIIFGGQDAMCHIETGLKIYQSIGPERGDVELSVFEKCGHFPHLEQPEKTAAHILAFARRHSSYDSILKKKVGKEPQGELHIGDQEGNKQEGQTVNA